MEELKIRLLVDRSLEKVDGIQQTIRKISDCDITVCDLADMVHEDADVILLGYESGDAGPDDAVTAQLFRRARVIMVSSDIRSAGCELAIVRGASGLLSRSASAATIAKAARCVACGELWLDRQTTGRVFDRLSRGMIRKKVGGAVLWS